jgi:serine-type D-Ala-D-Ala carboxypeptidase/endopeptidase
MPLPGCCEPGDSLISQKPGSFCDKHFQLITCANNKISNFFEQPGFAIQMKLKRHSSRNMNTRIIMQASCLALSLSTFAPAARAEDFTNAIQAYLQHRGEVEKRAGCIVVGLVDERGESVISYGTLDNGTSQEANGDTVFGIHSETCIYTAMLFEDMVERGEMKPDDPAAKYLPKTVRMPTRNGHQITLRHLVTETAGLPNFVDKLQSRDADNPLAGYTVDEMYAFLSSYQLTGDPGARFEHGGVAMGLLGQIMAVRAGTNFETLMVDRILRPLNMDSTRFTLTPELRSRLAAEHFPSGKARPPMDWGALAPLAGLRSTVNDLLKFVSVNLGLTPSSLTPLLEKHVAHLPWAVPAEENHAIVQFGGGGMYNTAYCGFDRSQHRGLVVLSTSDDGRYNALAIGRYLFEACEWRTDRRPMATNADSRDYSRYIGQFEAKSNSSSSPSKIDIRQIGDRLFIEVMGTSTNPIDLRLPPGSGELLPQSEATFFERLSGATVTFSLSRPNVIGLTFHHGNKVISYAKISDRAPKPTQ